MRRLLFEYAATLDSAFLPHVPAVALALIPAITFRFNEEVRSAAALALAKVRRDCPHRFIVSTMFRLAHLSCSAIDCSSVQSTILNGNGRLQVLFFPFVSKACNHLVNGLN